ncbi:cobalamin biosynthesis protein CobD [Clostridiaceae bacterium]|nr:cobalamin biosynthesis protein CobD [Clostridiaceae bacterium]RKI10418.1 cobalamin biosynthesis protein CobD [bacterium 1XD21-70]
MELAIAAGIGFLLDQWIGDPEGWWHPIRAIGWLVGRMERLLRRVFPAGKAGELAAGGVLAVLVPVAAGGAAAAVLAVAGRIHPAARFLVMCVMDGQILAAKSLKTESAKVYDALKDKEAEKARQAVSRIVGRDTERLSEEGIIKAAVETVAENTSDGVIAPLFYLFLGGPVLGFAYKAVNTMDSMVGYKNETYLYFGRAAAKSDDFVNLVPARLAAFFLIGAAWLLPGFDGRGAWRIWCRDRHCHKSPNSAQGEAACAGALGIELAGPAWYFGVLHEKPVIGDRTRKAAAEDIVRVNRLMTAGSWMALAAGLVVFLAPALIDALQ